MVVLRFCLFFVVVVSDVYGAADEQYKIVKTLNGQVQGVRETTLFRKIPFYSFKGIPYAKPPINDLRFKPPQPVESWKNVLDAFKHGKGCIQPPVYYLKPIETSEDCLTLNIYVPANIEPNEKLAVLLFVHGGIYIVGSGDDDVFGPDFIIEKQTIVVTINYRLGLFGFLSLDTPEYSGNMGLKDQQLALKWVSSNIEKFGGDSKRITFAGESAGGASINFHILSTESRKYFRNAILISGVADNYWAMSEVNDHLELAHKIAADSGEPKKTYGELVAFLKSAPADKLNEYNKVTPKNTLFNSTFAPTIERLDAEQPFLTEYLEKIYETTKIDLDVLFTMNSAEFLGLYLMASPLEDVVNNEYVFSLPFRGLNVSKVVQRNLSNKLRELYFNGSTDALKQYVDLLSDTNFGYAIDKTVKIHAAKSKGRTFYTIISIDSKLNGLKLQSTNVGHLPGTSHYDEMFYLFRSKSVQSLYDAILSNKEDEGSKICLKAIDNITNLFTNFAKYGELFDKNSSNIEIQPVQGDKVHFLELSNDGFTTGLNRKKEVYDLWAGIEEQAKRSQ